MTIQYPLTPLETFRDFIKYSPFHFWGLSNSSIAPTSNCNDLVRKYAWQAVQAAGREDILDAILNAENKLLEHLHYAPALHFTSETLQWPKFYDKSLDRYGSWGADGRWLSTRLSEGKIQAVGVETLTLIGAATVTLSDADGDGVNDTFTASTVATTTETNIDNIGVYFNTADRAYSVDSEIGDRWEIKPVTVTINANGTVSIKGRCWLIASPVLYEGVATTSGLDPQTASNFATSLDIYRHFTDPDGNTTATSQAKLIWETSPYPGWPGCCSGSSITFLTSATDPASVAEAVARAGIRDAELGYVTPAAATFDSANNVWGTINYGVCKNPDRVLVRYRAGVPFINGRMDKRFSNLVCMLAAAELNKKICACDEANRELYRWSFDLARAAGNNDEQYRIGNNDLDNPLGTRAGQVLAWKAIVNLRNVQGFAV